MQTSQEKLLFIAKHDERDEGYIIQVFFYASYCDVIQGGYL